MCKQRIRAKNCCLPRLLRAEPYRGIDRTTVDLNLEMEVRAGRHTCGADRPDGLAGRDRTAVHHQGCREVAVEDANVLIDSDEDEQTCTAGIESNMSRAAGRGINRGSLWGGEVDAGVYVPAGTERIERFQLKGGATEWLRHHGARNDRAEREPFMTLDPRSSNEPDQGRRAAHRGNPHKARHP
jgi:hypothetical protein